LGKGVNKPNEGGVKKAGEKNQKTRWPEKKTPKVRTMIKKKGHITWPNQKDQNQQLGIVKQDETVVESKRKKKRGGKQKTKRSAEKVERKKYPTQTKKPRIKGKNGPKKMTSHCWRGVQKTAPGKKTHLSRLGDKNRGNKKTHG